MVSRIKMMLTRRNGYLQSKTQVLDFYENDPARKCFELPAEVKIREIRDIAQYEQFCEVHELAVLEENMRRLSSGSVFYCILSEDAIVSSGWIASKEIFWIAEIDVLINMAHSPVAILYDFMTTPPFRGHGWYAKLLHNMISSFDGGASKFLIYAKHENEASNRGIKKAGFKHLGSFSRRDKQLIQLLEECGFRVLGSKYKSFGFKYKKV